MKLTYNIFIVLSIISTLLMSCSGKYTLRNKISALEKNLNESESISDSILEPLLMSYTSYIRKFPKDKMSPVFLYKVGSIYVRMENWKEAAKHFEFVIERYPESDIYPEAILLAAYSYETIRANKEERAETLYKLYLEKFPDGPGKKRAEYYFKPEDFKMRSRIADYQKNINSKNGIDRQTAHLLVRQYMSYIKKYPKSEFSPNYCFEGAKLASSIGEVFDAIEFWLTIFEIYQDYKYYPETLVFLAVEFENKMPLYIKNNSKSSKMYDRLGKYDFEKTDWIKVAEKFYKLFINNFPEHELIEQTKASLKYLGKSPNEVVEELNRISLKSNESEN